MKKYKLYKVSALTAAFLSIFSITSFAEDVNTTTPQKLLDDNQIGVFSLPDSVEEDVIATKSYKLSNGKTIGLKIRYDLYKDANNYKAIYEIKEVKPYQAMNIGITKVTIDDWWVESMATNKKSAKIKIMGDYKYTYGGFSKTDEFEETFTLYAGD